MGTAAAPHRRRLGLLLVSLASIAVVFAFVSIAGATGDTTPPSTPILTLKKATASSLLVTWTPSTDNVGVTAYDVFLMDKHIGLTPLTAATFPNLACNTRYGISVVALDAAGNRALPARLLARTSACSTGASTGTGSPAPTPAPTPPPTTGPITSPTPPPPPSGSASGTLAVATNGSDQNPCSLTAPCATFDRAYHRASSGQTIQVSGGSYPKQSITPDPTKTGAFVVFQPASGASVTVGGLTINGNHVEFRDMQTTWHTGTTANGVTLRNISSPGAVYVNGSSNVSVLGGQIYSPVPVSSDSQISSLYGKVPTNVVFDGVSFHDFRDVSAGNQNHIECLQVGAAINLTVQNSTFSNCETHDIFIRSWGYMNNSPSPLSNILIQNNSMAKTLSGYYSMQFLDDLWTGSPRTSVSILHNQLMQGIVVNVTHGTAQLSYNYIPAMTAYFCSSFANTVVSYNTYGYGVPCGTGDVVLNGTGGAVSGSSTGSPTTTSKTGTSGTTSTGTRLRSS